MLLILHYKTMYYYRKGFTEYIYHVGNASELNSIIRNGLIPGGKSIKRGRDMRNSSQKVNPMDDEYGMAETPRDLTKPWIARYFCAI